MKSTTTGKHIHLDIEPEPNGLVENTGEIVQYFTRDLKSDPLLLRYFTVCFDTCHMAVEYEDIARPRNSYAPTASK